ncbi:hypothetical protein NP493_91g05010 [Ridgeia piscesae]|uniref:Uncharacterized protein n=1 Tax=Ridgeia piscesae TaxID=27915 RepID=A0AAD9P8A4_RIDPI|nr:hypothetical protein NP493_91g05010 [Ridgeia piscesae]
MLDALLSSRRHLPRSGFRAQVSQRGDQDQDQKTPWIHVSTTHLMMRKVHHAQRLIDAEDQTDSTTQSNANGSSVS